MLNSIMFALNLIYRAAIIPLFTISIAPPLFFIFKDIQNIGYGI